MTKSSVKKNEEPPSLSPPICDYCPINNIKEIKESQYEPQDRIPAPLHLKPLCPDTLVKKMLLQPRKQVQTKPSSNNHFNNSNNKSLRNYSFSSPT